MLKVQTYTHIEKIVYNDVVHRLASHYVLNRRKIIAHFMYAYNIDIRKLTIPMSVAIYMFLRLQSGVENERAKSKEWSRKRRCG